MTVLMGLVTQKMEHVWKAAVLEIRAIDAVNHVLLIVWNATSLTSILALVVELVSMEMTAVLGAKIVISQLACNIMVPVRMDAKKATLDHAVTKQQVLR